MPKKTLLDKIHEVVYMVSNPKIGLFLASVDSLYVFLINSQHSTEAGIHAASRNFVYRIVMSGVNTRLCQNMSKIKNPYLAWTLAEIIPAITATLGAYLVHRLGGTPKPLESLIFSTATGMAILGPTLIYGTRKGYID